MRFDGLGGGWCQIPPLPFKRECFWIPFTLYKSGHPHVRSNKNDAKISTHIDTEYIGYPKWFHKTNSNISSINSSAITYELTIRLLDHALNNEYKRSTHQRYDDDYGYLYLVALCAIYNWYINIAEMSWNKIIQERTHQSLYDLKSS